MSDYDESLHRHDKNRRWSQGKQRLKRCVFRRLRKTGSEGADVTCGGRPFQIRAAATGKAYISCVYLVVSHASHPISAPQFLWLSCIYAYIVECRRTKKRHGNQYGDDQYGSATPLRLHKCISRFVGALTLLVGRQKGHPACKKLDVRLLVVMI